MLVDCNDKEFRVVGLLQDTKRIDRGLERDELRIFNILSA